MLQSELFGLIIICPQRDSITHKNLIGVLLANLEISGELGRKLGHGVKVQALELWHFELGFHAATSYGLGHLGVRLV